MRNIRSERAGAGRCSNFNIQYFWEFQSSSCTDEGNLTVPAPLQVTLARLCPLSSLPLPFWQGYFTSSFLLQSGFFVCFGTGIWTEGHLTELHCQPLLFSDRISLKYPGWPPTSWLTLGSTWDYRPVLPHLVATWFLRYVSENELVFPTSNSPTFYMLKKYFQNTKVF